MPRFDIVQERAILLGNVGYQFSLAASFEHSRSLSGLATSGHAFITQGLYCLLVEFDEPARQLFVKAKEWIEYALSHGEKNLSIRDGMCYHDLSLTNWLLSGQEDKASLAELVIKDDEWYAAPKRLNKTDVLLTLHKYIDARAYRRAIALFEATPGMKVPADAEGVSRSEAQLCYALAKSQLGEGFSGEDVREEIGKFLARNIDTFLSNGWTIRAATWVKIAYWNLAANRSDPQTVVMKCLEHLRR